MHIWIFGIHLNQGSLINCLDLNYFLFLWDYQIIFLYISSFSFRATCNIHDSKMTQPTIENKHMHQTVAAHMIWKKILLLIYSTEHNESLWQRGFVMKASFWRFRPRRELREAIQLLSRKCEIAPGMCFLNTVLMPLISDLDYKQFFE